MALVHPRRPPCIVLPVGGLPVGVGQHPQRADHPVGKCLHGISGPFGHPAGFFVLPTGLKSGAFHSGRALIESPVVGDGAGERVGVGVVGVYLSGFLIFDDGIKNRANG
jgi:hypothetical protein